jgi:hypothetical protein
MILLEVPARFVSKSDLPYTLSSAARVMQYTRDRHEWLVMPARQVDIA